jgi:kelch-like protein 10
MAYSYDVLLLQVEEVDPLVPRKFHGTAVVGFDIFIIGGIRKKAYLRSCHSFNVVKKKWREVAPMRYAR